jgi:SAM-dependent methyltransferase
MGRPQLSLRRRVVDRLHLFGLNLPRLRTTLRNWYRFRSDWAEFQRQKAGSPVAFAEDAVLPYLFEQDEEGGFITCPYFQQDMLIARKIFVRNPQRHLDIGSRVDGFVAHVAVFREIEIIDIRPLKSEIFNIKVRCADLSAPLAPELIACCDSLSCLHALEHFGLGRYGDPIKYTGYLDGLENIHKILKPGGKFYFSVPIGPQRVQFNAQRIFSTRYLWDLLQARYQIDAFSYVDDAACLHLVPDLQSAGVPKQIDDNFGCWEGCGIFELTKL